MKVLSPAVLAALILLAPGLPAQEKPTQPKEAQREQSLSRGEIEGLVRQYLLDHPEILIEMSQRLRERQEVERRAQAATAIQAKRAELAGDPVMAMGAKADAPGVVTIVEFFDYRCGYCKRVAPTLQKLVADDPGLRIVLQEFPILGPESVEAAKAALAARPQGKYLAVHQALLQATDLSAAGIEKAVRGAGVDWDQWQKAVRSPEVEAIIAKTRVLAAELSLEATPAFVIGNEVIPGAMNEAGFRERIAQLRGAAKSPAPGQ